MAKAAPGIELNPGVHGVYPCLGSLVVVVVGLRAKSDIVDIRNEHQTRILIFHSVTLYMLSGFMVREEPWTSFVDFKESQ